MPTAPVTAKGRAAVQRILDAACALFARQGVRATTLDQVGALSGTGRGQLYRCFAGKDELVAAVVAQQVDRVLDAQRPLLARMAAAADVREWCAVAAAQYAEEERPRCPIGSLVYELAGSDGPARAALAAGLQRWGAALAEGLRRVEARGGLAPGADPDALATALLAAYQGGVLLAAATGDLAPLRAALDAVAGPALTAR